MVFCEAFNGKEVREKEMDMPEIEEKQLFFDEKDITVCPIASIYGKVKVISFGDVKEAKKKCKEFKRGNHHSPRPLG